MNNNKFLIMLQESRNTLKEIAKESKGKDEVIYNLSKNKANALNKFIINNSDELISKFEFLDKFGGGLKNIFLNNLEKYRASLYESDNGRGYFLEYSYFKDGKSVYAYCKSSYPSLKQRLSRNIINSKEEAYDNGIRYYERYHIDMPEGGYIRVDFDHFGNVLYYENTYRGNLIAKQPFDGIYDFEYSEIGSLNKIKFISKGRAATIFTETFGHYNNSKLSDFYKVDNDLVNYNNKVKGYKIIYHPDPQLSFIPIGVNLIKMDENNLAGEGYNTTLYFPVIKKK